MSPTIEITRAKWLQSKVKLAHSRQQAISAAFLTRFGLEATRAMAALPLPKAHPKTIEDKIAVVETREASLIATFISTFGGRARAVASEAARKHGIETGRSATKVIHATHTTPEHIYSALRYFLLDGGPEAPEPVIMENTPKRFTWSRIVCPNHAYWSEDTANYLFLVQIEAEWISGFVEGYCYSASHTRDIYMNIGPASYCDTIVVENLK